VAKFCNGVAHLDKIVAPDGNLTRVWGIPGLVGTLNCADNDCQPFGAASTTTYSVVAMMIAAMLALLAL